MRRYVWIAIAACAIAVAACGDSPSSTVGDSGVTTAAPTGTGTPGTTAATPTTAAPTTTASAAAATIEIASDDLGDHLVDGDGYTLYLYVPDDAGPSTCEGSCAASWPPAVGDFAAGDGVDASLLGSSPRGDGGSQVTYNGWPLYYYGGDSAPGDTSGQAVSGVWYVVDASGQAIEAASDPREDYYGDY